MRRRWKVCSIIGVCVVMAAAFIALAPESGSGLEWIRKYDGSEVVKKRVSHGNWQSTDHEFRFHQLPETLIAEIGMKLTVGNTEGPLSGGFIEKIPVVIDRRNNLIVIRMPPDHTSWIQRKWMGILRLLGRSA